MEEESVQDQSKSYYVYDDFEEEELDNVLMDVEIEDFKNQAKERCKDYFLNILCNEEINIVPNEEINIVPDDADEDGVIMSDEEFNEDIGDVLSFGSAINSNKCLGILREGKMQLRLVTMEEGKEPTINSIRVTNQSRGVPMRLLGFLMLFVGICIGFSIINMFKIRYLGTQNIISGAQTLIQSCFKESTSLQDWIEPPSTYMHTLDDSELFWRASFVPQIKEYPFRRSPKIAFMFLTRGPLPLSPLWEKFFKGNEELYSIYVHTMPAYRANFSTSSVFYQKQIPSQVVEWGMMSMCDAERRLLANALLDISNEWFVLLSEACIPLQKFNIIYHYISRSRFSFMGAIDERGPYGRGRYDDKMLPEVSLDQWRKGSQWFEANRKLAVDIIKDLKYYPKFEQFCKPDCYVDEHYFPTMLTIESPHLLANRTLTFVDWSRGGAHPATFGKNDVTVEFFRRIQQHHTCVYNNQPTSVCFLFARKFAPNALDILLQNSTQFFGY